MEIGNSFAMVSSVSMVYAACVALFEANPKRATTFWASDKRPATARVAAVGLLLCALVLLTISVGFELAVPTLIVMLAFSGIACVLIAEFRPGYLFSSAIALLILGIILPIVSLGFAS